MEHGPRAGSGFWTRRVVSGAQIDLNFLRAVRRAQDQRQDAVIWSTRHDTGGQDLSGKKWQEHRQNGEALQDSSGQPDGEHGPMR
jgi:hypothetical protein